MRDEKLIIRFLDLLVLPIAFVFWILELRRKSVGESGMGKVDLVRLYLEGLGYYCNCNSNMVDFLGDHVRVYRSWWSWFFSIVRDDTPVAVISEYRDWGPRSGDEDGRRGLDDRVRVDLCESWRLDFQSSLYRGKMVDLHDPGSLDKIRGWIDALFTGSKDLMCKSS